MSAFVGTFTYKPSRTFSPSTPLTRSWKCCANAETETTDIKPPTSLESTVSLATQAISDAINDGHKRIRVSALIPGLNPLIEETVPYSASLLNLLAKGLVQYTPQLIDKASSSPSALLFASAGTAAAAAAQYNRDASPVAEGVDGVAEQSQVKTASFSKRDTMENRTSSSANVLVAPLSSRGDPIMDDLETVIEENADACWILLNPDLGADRAAVGMRESTRRASFEQSFHNTFYFRNLFEIQRPRMVAVERGALLFCHGLPWCVFALIDGEYLLAEQLQTMPNSEQITAIINRANAKWRRDASPKPAAGLDVEISRLFGWFFRK